MPELSDQDNKDTYIRNPFVIRRSLLVLLIPITFILIVVLSGNLLYQMEKNKGLAERKRLMEQKIKHQQAAPLRNSQTACLAN